MQKFTPDSTAEQKLRSGFTTGSCAAACTRAAAELLFSGERMDVVQLETPSGRVVPIEIRSLDLLDGTATASVQKDSGDDPDVTNGTFVFADVRFSDRPGIHIDGGQGVGRVTKPGLDQPVGNAAINSTPRRMIEQEVRNAAANAGIQLASFTDAVVGARAALQPERQAFSTQRLQLSKPTGVDVIIRIPAGEELAKKTFNPRLGIVGGISVLGTTGIVEPMSERSLLATIEVEVNVRKAEGYDVVCAAPGNYGMHFLEEAYQFPTEIAVTASNYIWDTVRYVEEAGFRKLLLAGHIGKFIKVAGGIKNTHSKYGDHRMEILANFVDRVLMPEGARASALESAARAGEGTAVAEKIAASAGEGKAAAETAARIRAQLEDCVMMDDAIRILDEAGIRDEVMQRVVDSIKEVAERWFAELDAERREKRSAGPDSVGYAHAPQVEVVTFSNVYGTLAMTEKAEDMIWYILSERDRVRRTSSQSEDRNS